MPDPNTEHGLRVQLATALRERDAEKARADAASDRLETAARAYIEGHGLALTRAEKAEEALAAARRECEGLRKALSNACAALTLAGAELARRLNERREKMSTTEAVNDEVAEAVVRAARDASAALADPAGGEEPYRCPHGRGSNESCRFCSVTGELE